MDNVQLIPTLTLRLLASVVCCKKLLKIFPSCEEEQKCKKEKFVMQLKAYNFLFASFIFPMKEFFNRRVKSFPENSL
jgi:hypothetical protein